MDMDTSSIDCDQFTPASFPQKRAFASHDQAVLRATSIGFCTLHSFFPAKILHIFSTKMLGNVSRQLTVQTAYQKRILV